MKLIFILCLWENISFKKNTKSMCTRCQYIERDIFYMCAWHLHILKFSFFFCASHFFFFDMHVYLRTFDEDWREEFLIESKSRHPSEIARSMRMHVGISFFFSRWLPHLRDYSTRLLFSISRGKKTRNLMWILMKRCRIYTNKTWLCMQHVTDVHMCYWSRFR